MFMNITEICTFSLFILVGTIISLLFSAKPAYGALPPLSENERQESCQYIVIATVLDVTSEVIPVDMGTDIKFTAIVKVENVTENQSFNSWYPEQLQATLQPPIVDQEIKVTYFQTGDRPDGWVGPGGQYSSLYQGLKAKLYLNQSLDGTFNLIEPNGIDKLS